MKHVLVALVLLARTMVAEPGSPPAGVRSESLKAGVPKANAPALFAVSPLVGDTVDAAERDSFRLFPGIEAFHDAVFLALPDSTFRFRIAAGRPDRLRTVEFTLARFDLHRIRYIIENRELMARQSDSEPSAAAAIAAFWARVMPSPPDAARGTAKAVGAPARDHAPGWRADHFAVESCAGLLTGGLGSTAGAIAGVMVGLLAGAGQGEWGGLGLLVCGGIGAIVGYPAGTAVGVSALGRGFGDHGRYWAACLGSYAGAAVGSAVLAVSSQTELYVVPVVLAPVGGAIGYNLSRPPVPEGKAFISRFELPSLALTPVAGERRDVAVDARLLTVRF